LLLCANRRVIGARDNKVCRGTSTRCKHCHICVCKCRSVEWIEEELASIA
jgi:hypothetical protein